MNIIFYFSVFIIFIVTSLLVRKCTRAFLYSVLLFSYFLINLAMPAIGFWNKVMQFLFCSFMFLLHFIISKKFNYDFSGKVFGFVYISNMIKGLTLKNEERIIGKVIPYNNYQMKYNGAYMIANELVTAGMTLISGSTGSGKTYGIMSLIKQNIRNNRSVIFAEYKGDNKNPQKLKKYAEKYGYEIYTLKNGDADFNYDPLQNINNVGRIEAILNMRKWSLDGADAHYRTATQLVLQNLVGEFSNLDKGNEKVFGYTYRLYKHIKAYNPERSEVDAYNTVSKLLELLIESSLNKMFIGGFNKTLSFDELANQKFLLIVSFVSSNKELATSFSSLMFKDMLDQFTNSTPKNNIFLYVDEFGTLDNPFIIKDILEKGRSAKIAATLSLLDLNQIVIQTNEAYLNSLLGIINNFIIYNGATRNTAEKLAGVQLMDIESVIMNLRKPLKGKSPTAIYISKYPTLNKKNNTEVFRFEPYIEKDKDDEDDDFISNTAVVGKFDSEIQKDLNLEVFTENQEQKTINENENKNCNYDDFI